MCIINISGVFYSRENLFYYHIHKSVNACNGIDAMTISETVAVVIAFQTSDL